MTKTELILLAAEVQAKRQEWMSRDDAKQRAVTPEDKVEADIAHIKAEREWLDADRIYQKELKAFMGTESTNPPKKYSLSIKTYDPDDEDFAEVDTWEEVRAWFDSKLNYWPRTSSCHVNGLDSSKYDWVTGELKVKEAKRV